MKKKSKRIIAGVMAVFLCFGMTGCGSEKKSIDDITEKYFEEAAAELDKNYKDSDKKETESEVQEIDPFEELNVTFSGTYPESKIQCSGGSPYVSFTPSMEKGIKNGDTVTITAELKSSYENKYKLTETQKEYTAEGLCSYAMSIEEIPQDMMDKMAQQSIDSIVANTAKWKEGNVLLSSDFLGYYFLTSKEGYSQKPFNDLYFVYKNTASVTGLKRGGDGQTEETGTEEYYTYYHFTDILLMPDGTCSVDLSGGKLTSNIIESDYGYWNLIASFYTYDGYKELDSMFNECVVSKIETYNYESTVQ